VSFEKVINGASASMVSLGNDDNNSGHLEHECKNYDKNKSAEKEDDTWCFQAHQVCCSSVKKWCQFTAFCDYYAFLEPDGDCDEGITGYVNAGDNVGSINCKYCDGASC
jgi:hypothetical protein